jgi:peptide/nickel transport system substrate-binding protein
VGLPTLDPAIAYSNLSSSLLAMTNDGLVTYRRTAGPAGAEIVPDLAAELPGESPDGRTYTFQLRRGVLYSTGAPVQASDFRASMERVFRLAKAPPYYNGIVGASACTATPSRCNLSKGIATDNKTGTITVHLTEPDPEFLYKLALPFADVLPTGTPARDLRLGAHPSTGPYSVRGLIGGHILLARNPHFRVWSAAAQPPGYPDRITVTAASGSGARTTARDLLAVAAGRYDWTPDTAVPSPAPPGLVARLVHDDATQMHPYAVNTVRYFFLNTLVAPFNDIRVRHAVNLAVDRHGAVDAFGGPFLATPTCQSEPPSLFGYTPYCPYTAHPTPSGRWTAPDLSAARALIHQAHADGDPVTVFAPQEDPAPGALMARTMRAIGLRARLRVFPRPGIAYYNYIGTRANRVQAGLEGWNVDYPEPSNLFTELLRCSDATPVHSLDESGFCDHGIDQEMDAALRLQEADPASARLLWARIDREITDRAPWVPLTNDRLYDVVSQRVGNYEHHPQFGLLIDQAWVQ